MYKIDWTGKTVREELPNEDLDVSSLEHLCVVAVTIIKDITGDFSSYDEIWSALNDYLENTWNKIKLGKAYQKGLAPNALR